MQMHALVSNTKTPFDHDDAVAWHDAIATKCAGTYTQLPGAAAHRAAWMRMIDKYSNRRSAALDVGCGNGAFTVRLAERNRLVLAIDTSAAMLELTRAKVVSSGLANVELRCCDASEVARHALPQTGLIICSSVLEYVEDLDGTLRVLASLLVEDGVILLSLPNGQSVARWLTRWMYLLTGRPRYYRYVVNVRTRSAIERILVASGMQILEHRYYGRTPVLSLLLRPLRLRRFADSLFVLAAKRVGADPAVNSPG